MKRVAIVQARMRSTRLPGKVLLPIAGEPMLAQQLRRLRRARLVDQVVVATSTDTADDPISRLAEAEAADCFRGDETDVLARYVGAARAFDAEVVIRITADCPLIDAPIVDRVIERLTARADRPEPLDYVSNIIRRTYPRGLDVEAMHRDVLERMARVARSTAAREHVTYFLRRERPDLFITDHVCNSRDDSDLRWTVDTEEDLAAVRAIYASLSVAERDPSYDQLIEFVRANPHVSALNAGIEARS